MAAAAPPHLQPQRTAEAHRGGDVGGALQRAMIAGRRSTIAFQTCRAVW